MFSKAMTNTINARSFSLVSEFSFFIGSKTYRKYPSPTFSCMVLVGSKLTIFFSSVGNRSKAVQFTKIPYFSTPLPRIQSYLLLA